MDDKPEQELPYLSNESIFQTDNPSNSVSSALHVLSTVALASAEEDNSSRVWAERHSTNLPAFGSPTFVEVLAGSPSGLSIQAHSYAEQKPVGSPFRSPPFRSESSSLMELKTVTPSRIRSSPRGILRSETNDMDCVALSQSALQDNQSHLIHQAPLTEVVVHDISTYKKTLKPISSSETGEFKIVIGGDSPEHSAPVFWDEAETANQKQQHQQQEEGDSDDEVDSKNIKDIQEALNIQQDMLTEGVKVARKRKSSKLPRELRGLMGEANLRYARGEHEDTIKMCLEVIRLAPYAAEPFETLAMIYEERGETAKALQYSLLAAHVSSPDAEQWLHLAQMCLQQNDRFKALNCFCKAFSADRSNFEIAIRCGDMYKEIGSYTHALHKYKAAMLAMKNSEAAVDLSREAAKSFHTKEENMCAIEILEAALKQHPLLFKDEDANMLCELLLFSGRFASVLQTLASHSGISLAFKSCEVHETNQSETPNEDFEALEKIHIPNSVPVDLKCKAVVAVIRLNKSHLIEDLVKTICDYDPSDIGDLQFEIAEAFMEASKPQKALKILDLLISSPKYALAAVWLRHADCCVMCGDVEKSLASYRKCLSLAPGHVHTYMSFSDVLGQMERYEPAVQVLNEALAYDSSAKVRTQLYAKRFSVYKQWGEKTGRLEKLSLAADEALAMLGSRLKACFIDAKLSLVRRKNPPPDPVMGYVKLTQVEEADKLRPTFEKVTVEMDHTLKTKEEWLQILKETIAILICCKRFSDAVNLGEASQYLSVWSDHLATRQVLENLTFSACLLAKNFHLAYNYVRLWLMQNPETVQLWNLFNQITARSEDQRHHRYCIRLGAKLPDHDILRILSGHNFLAAGSYRSAMAEYVRAHKKDPHDPLLLMLVGVVYIHIASQKFSEQKNSLVVQGLSFLDNYAKVREVPQESFYNIGRALHQLGLEHFAIHYYTKALEAPVVAVTDPVIKGVVMKVAGSNPADFNLRWEIAYNLSLIYRRSGNHVMANQVLSQHLVV